MDENHEPGAGRQKKVYDLLTDMKMSVNSLRIYLSGHGRDIEKIRRDVATCTLQLSGVKRMLGAQNAALDQIIRRLSADD